MRSWVRLVLCGVLFVLAPGAAFADGIPLGDADFTAYIQHKMQLYSAAPVRVIGPFNVAIGEAGGANLVYDFKTLHDQCVKDPAQCPSLTHDYVQDAVSRFPGANSEADTGEAVPGGKTEFMAWLAAELGRRLPGDTVEADGMTLKVTRPGGSAVPFDQRGYYQLCQQANFSCASALRQSLERTAAWMTPAEPSRLRISLHIMASCTTIASVGNSVSCKIVPLRDPMAPFFRRAFANLEEICFKQTDYGLLPVTNADRHDAGLDIEAALDLCDKSTHDVLGPLTAKPAAAGEIGLITGPYAASRVLFAADWQSLAQQGGGHLIVAVPSRDTLIFMAGDSPAEIAALGAAAQRSFASSPLPISSDVYRWNGDGWSLATERSTMLGGPLISTDLMPHTP